MKHGAVFAITGVLAGSLVPFQRVSPLVGTTLAGVAQHAAPPTPPAPPGPPDPQPAAPYTYQGTVHSVQAKTGTLELITGVGHALRLVQIRVPTGLRVAGTAGGASLGVRGVKPGDVVRVVCHRAGRSLVADKVEKLEPTP